MRVATLPDGTQEHRKASLDPQNSALVLALLREESWLERQALERWRAEQAERRSPGP